MSERLRTTLLVTIIATFIWLYAEQENPAQPLRASITLRIDEGDLIGRLSSPLAEYAIVIHGPTSRLDALRRELERTGNRVTLTIGKEIPPNPGLQQLLLRDVLEAHDWFRDPRLTVTEEHPQAFEVLVDRWMVIEVDVKAADEVRAAADGSIEIEPRRVPVRVGSLLYETLVPDALEVIALAEPADLAGLREGQVQTLSVRLQIPPHLARTDMFQAPDERVRLTFRARSRLVQITRRSVPIKIVITPLDHPVYDIDLHDTVIPEVRLSGTSEAVARVERGEVRVIGHLDLTSEDLQMRIREKQVTFDHLPGLTIVSGPHVARFEVRERGREEN